MLRSAAAEDGRTPGALPDPHGGGANQGAGLVDPSDDVVDPNDGPNDGVVDLTSLGSGDEGGGGGVSAAPSQRDVPQAAERGLGEGSRRRTDR